MSNIGQPERTTQNRVVKLFRDQLGYDYLGDLRDENNSNLKPELLTAWLTKQNIDNTLINRVLHDFTKTATDTSKSLYDRNHAVYDVLRYGIKVKPDASENTATIWLIDWKNPQNNHFAIAEEVTVKGANPKANTKCPDVVIYVNGIAFGILELKRAKVSVSEGIRQNLDNQTKDFIEPFFSTMQLVMAGNDSEGLRYGSIGTPETYYLKWTEGEESHDLDLHLSQLCEKNRFLELIHDFTVFDAGTKKLCRHNQYFGVKAAQACMVKREGGIIWHTQGSGKSLTMVWLAKWIRENRTGARVLIITDRTELDQQIETVFGGVNETIYRTTNGADLIDTLNGTTENLICSLVHKFSNKLNSEEPEDGEGAKALIQLLSKLPENFKAKGDLHVFVDECHRTQSGDMHKAMKAILPNAIFVGFTGTPLLKSDKQRSVEVFGRYIHTYKFDQAVREGVVLDLRYEARDIDQQLTDNVKVDLWFEAKTKGLSDVAKSRLKQKWGTMQRVLSSKSRLEKIVTDIVFDMNTKARLMDGHGNAMLVAGSIYEACKFYELFSNTELKGKCAVVTSYTPSVSDIKGETTGTGETDNVVKYRIYRQMLADWFDAPAEKCIGRIEEFEKEVKKQFIKSPAQMKLIIVVDKLLTGFDAPSATYLYIDKQMRDHGLFQAICRVNRLDGESKRYGYIVDYKDLFKNIAGAVTDYTSGALDGFDADDVKGLLENRLEKAKKDLEDAREAVKALCEPVLNPKEALDYFHYFCAEESGNATQLKDNEPNRLKLYKFTAALIRAYANIVSELAEAGYNSKDIAKIKFEAKYYSDISEEVKRNSGDYIDLKAYEPDMRFLIDTYINAENSKSISTLGNQSLVELLVEQGAGAIDTLSETVRKNETAVAETIENNVRRLIVDESPIDPAYYEKISELLDKLIEQRRKGGLEYQTYLAKIIELATQASTRTKSNDIPDSIKTSAQLALYNNLGSDEELALKVNAAILSSKQNGWRDNSTKIRKIRIAIKPLIGDDDKTDQILELAKKQNDY